MKSKIIFVFTIITLLSYNNVFGQDNEVYYKKLEEVFKYIDQYYVDSVNMETTITKIIISTLKDLDPHSTYISKENVAELNQSLEGSFEGVGIYYNIIHDTLVVISSIPEGPAEKVGIKAGDRIVKIENEIIAGIGINNDMVKLRLQGKKGSTVNMTIKRKNVENLLDFSVTRDKIPIYSIDASYMIDDEIGYIKLNKFSATSITEFNLAMEKLDKQNIKHLILDLRDNGGGYLNTAVDLADQFLKREELIVYTEGVNSGKREYTATNNGKFEKGRLIVLIDEGSASASEILTGAIQDWDRGVIVGRRSFGKGLVQRPYSLSDGSVIRLTIARYYTPTGRLIQKSYSEGTDAYRQDIIKRYSAGELLHSDSIKFIDSLKFYTLKNKRTVYGGGGIMPDEFVPLDTTSLPKFYSNLIEKGIITNFILDYVEDNRQFFSQEYPDFKKFDTTFVVNEVLYNKLIKYANEELEEDKKLKISDFANNNSTINTQLKALIAKSLWTNSEYNQVVNKTNTAFLKAIEIISNNKTYENILKNK